MCNHHSNAQISKPALDKEGQHLVFTAFASIPAGAQVCVGVCVCVRVSVCVGVRVRLYSYSQPFDAQVYLNYGPLDNTQLLLYYGYAVRGNPYDTVGVHLEAPEEEQDSLASVKALILAHCNLDTDHMLRSGGEIRYIPQKSPVNCVKEPCNTQKRLTARGTPQPGVARHTPCATPGPGPDGSGDSRGPRP